MTKIYNSLAAIATIALGITSVHAQETKHLTLDEAIRLGIQNSKTLKIDDAKLKQANANYLEARNAQLPSASVNATALALTNANVDLKIMEGGAGGNAPKANSAFMGQLSASLPIYAGGKIRYGMESTKYLIEATKLSSENDKTAIAYNISQAYNNLFKSQQAINVLKENLTASQERDATFLRLENNGIIARNDRLKANLQTTNIELQLLEAENNFNIANINMDLLLGLNESTLIEIDQDYITEEFDEKPLEFYMSQAVDNRKDLKALDYQRKAAASGTKAAKAENYPTVGLSAGYVAADVPKILTITNAANIGLGIKYNLDTLWKKNSSLEKAKAKEEELSATNELVNDQIKISVNQDYQNAQLAKRKISVYQKALEQSEENYRITKNKYDNGLATMTDLLDANAAKISSKVNVINSKADAVLANIKLEETTGSLIIN